MELGGWLTQLKVIALDKNLISGHHTFFCLDLPFLHTQIHSSAVCLLSHKKHCWKVLAERDTLSANHCLKAHKVRKSEKAH